MKINYMEYCSAVSAFMEQEQAPNRVNEIQSACIFAKFQPIAILVLGDNPVTQGFGK